MNLFTIGIFFGIFLTEGLGLIRQQDYFGLFYTGITIFLTLFLIKKKAVVPLFFSAFYLIFLIFSLISSLNFSLDKEISFQWWLFYLSCFLIFVFFYNFKETGKAVVRKILLFSVPLFVFLFLLKKIFPGLILLKGLAQNENNLFFEYNSLHNHLGVIVGLLIIFMFWNFLENKKISALISGIVFFPFLLLSYNRSAILAFLIILVPLFVLFLRDRAIKKTTLIIIVLFAAALGFLLISSSYQGKAAERLGIKAKDSLGSRQFYWQQAVKSFTKKPFFGTGYGNFGYISYQYEQGYDQWIDNAANIFLEILTGGGLLNFLPFVIIIELILLKALRTKSVYSFLFIFLLINFQTDFSYRNYSIFVLFIILAALVYQEKQNEEIKGLFLGLFFVLASTILLITTSNYFLSINKLDLAQKAHPLNKKIYPVLIRKEIKIGDNKAAIKFNNFFGFIAPYNYERLVTAGYLYELLGNKEAALNYYGTICQINIYCDLTWIKKTASLINELYSKKETFIYLKDRIEIFKKAGFLSDQLENTIEAEIKNTCLGLTGNKECYFLNIKEQKYFHEPAANTVITSEKEAPNKAKYTINKDTLNERFNYLPRKEAGVYRIMVLGDSLAYGLFTDTDKNWVEQLENKLNKGKECGDIKKFEVINLGVDGYDINYTIERYRERGEKYHPDLIIWPITNFYKIYELIKRKVEDNQRTNNQNLTSDEIWEKSKEEVRNELGSKTILAWQKKQINQALGKLNKKLVFIDTGEIGEEEIKVLPPDVAVFKIIIPDNEYYPKTGVLNNSGNQKTAEEVYKYLILKPLDYCQK